jgi:hypothetical protein
MPAYETDPTAMLHPIWQTARDETLRPLLPNSEQPVDALEFVQEQEDVSFPETLRLL